MKSSEFNVGRIILEGETTEPYVLRDFDGVALFELVDGQYRIERLKDEEATAHTAHPTHIG